MLIIAFIILGAIVGSFCNVIIYRVPLIIQGENLSLSLPASHCLHCGKTIKVLHNIPIVSWIFLQGRCASCKHAISWYYPFVEVVVAVLYGLIIWRRGLDIQSGFDILAVTFLVPLFFIDLKTMLLPDRLTIPLLVLALLFAASGYSKTDINHSVTAAVCGFGIPWLLSAVFRLVRGYEGMGLGDMKLFAALGAWLGPLALIDVFTASSVLAVLSGVILLGVKPVEAFPFGPYLVVASISWVVIYH